MSAAPSMPLFLDAYLADTTHLSTEEHGAYLLLLMAMWRRNGMVPNDDKDLARIVGLTVRKWLQIKARLLPFLDDEDGELSQKRLQKEWEYVKKISETNTKNGKAGGRPKSIKNKDLGKANGSVPDNPNGTPHTHTQPTKKEDAVASSERAKEIEREFEDEFWPAYPLKRGKVHALKSFVAARKRASLEIIMAGVRRYAAERAGEETKFTKHAQGWLSGDHWTDEPAPPRSINRAHSPPNRKPTPVDAMEQIFREKGWTAEDEPECVPSNNGDAERLPAKLSGPSGVVVDLRPGTDWRTGSGD